MSLLEYLKPRTSRFKVNKLFEYMVNVEEAMNGNIDLACEPETLGTAVGDANGNEEDFTRDVEIKLEDSEGNVHTWFNEEIDVDIADDSTNGEAQFEDGTTATKQLELSRGVGTITVVYDTSGGDFAEGDVITLTASSSNILGYNITDATSVDTLTA